MELSHKQGLVGFVPADARPVGTVVSRPAAEERPCVTVELAVIAVMEGSVSARDFLPARGASGVPRGRIVAAVFANVSHEGRIAHAG